MEKNWIKVYTASEEYQAQLIVSLLEKYELQPVMMDKKDDEFRIGYAEVYVAQEEEERAVEIIESNKEK